MTIVLTSVQIGESTKKSQFDQLLDNDSILASADMDIHGEKTFYSSTVFHMSATFDGTVNMLSATTTYFAPVSGEPSLGTGHWRGDSAGSVLILNQNPATAGTWYDVTFSNAPTGTKCAWGIVLLLRAVAGEVDAYIRKNGDTIAQNNQLRQMWSGQNATRLGSLCRFPLDGNKKAEIGTAIADVQILIYEVIFYDI